MKYRLITSFFTLLFINSLIGQIKFDKTYDFLNKEEDKAQNLFLDESRNKILLSGESTCNNLLNFCNVGSVVNEDGIVERSWLTDNIISNGIQSFKDSIFTMVGNELDSQTKAPIVDTLLLQQVDFNGNIIFNNHYTDIDTSIVGYFSNSILQLKNGYLVYGNSRHIDNSNNQIRKGYLLFLNNELDVDTFMFIEPVLNSIKLKEAVAAQNGDIFIFYEYNELGAFINVMKNGVAKIDRNMTIERIWNSENYFGSYQSSSLVLVNDNLLIFDNFMSEDESNPEIMCIDIKGDFVWKYNLDSYLAFEKSDVNRIRVCRNGNIMIVGSYTFLQEKISHSGVIFKLDVTDGSLLWERTFVDWRVGIDGYFNIETYFSDVRQFENGDIVLLGGKIFSYDDPNYGLRPQRDSWILRLNEKGCLQDSCGGFFQNSDSTNENSLFSNLLLTWYVLEPNSETGIRKYRMFPYNSDSLYFLRSSDKFIGLDETIMEREEEFIKEKDGKVYFLKENDYELLYDFTLKINDEFESNLFLLKYKVIDVDTLILTNGVKKKYWKLKPINSEKVTRVWIENIGDTRGLLWHEHEMDTFCDRYLVEYYLRGSLYFNQSEGDCLLNDIDRIKFDRPLIYPNPASDIVFIEIPKSNDFLEIEIFNINGTLINKIQIANEQSKFELKINQYHSGIYIVKFKSKKGAHGIEQFVVI